MQGLTRRSKRIPLLSRLKFLLHSLLEAWLGQSRGTPYLKLDEFMPVQPMGVQDRREIDI